MFPLQEKHPMEKILPKESDIKGIRLIGDVELIAKISTSNAGTSLKTPLRVLMGRDPEGNMVMDLVPITLLTDTLLVPPSAIMALPFALDKEMEDAYIQRTSGIAGLQLAGV